MSTGFHNATLNVTASEYRRQKYNMQVSGARAIRDADQKNLEIRSRCWDVAYGYFAIIEGALVATAESMLTELMPKLRPTNNEQAVNKKKGKAAYKAWLKEKYPHYHHECAQALNYLQAEGVSFFERYSARELADGAAITNGMLDYGDSEMRQRKFVLYNSAKLEMASIKPADLDLRARVYACWAMWRLCQQQYIAFLNIGPNPNWLNTTLDDETNFNLIRLSDLYAEAHSPWYDSVYASRMKPADLSPVIKAMDTVKHQVCGTWTHKTDGYVNLQLVGIRNFICTNRFVQSLPFADIVNDTGFDYEMELLNQIYFYKEGIQSIDIYTLRGVRMALQGKTLEDIEKYMRKRYSVRKDKVDRLLLSVQIAKAIHDGTLDIEAFNRDIAERKDTFSVSEMRENLKGVELSATTIKQMISAIGENLQLQNEPPAPIVHHKRWTDEEERFLCNHYKDIPLCIKHLGRTERAIICKASKIGLYKPIDNSKQTTLNI